MKFHCIIITFFLVLILNSCTERPAKPKPFLSKKKMVELLTEFHQTEAALLEMQNQRYRFSSLNSFTTAAYSEIFEKYGLNKESFEANLYYRTYHSRDLEKIYVKVHENLIHIQEKNKADEIAE
jgi:hypothetical protein